MNTMLNPVCYGAMKISILCTLVYTLLQDLPILMGSFIVPSHLKCYDVECYQSKVEYELMFVIQNRVTIFLCELASGHHNYPS